MTEHILIVDDDRDHAESIGDVLDMRGYAIEIAVSGEEALAKFAGGRFDLTLMDVRLPGMNGVETFFHFRRLRPDAKVILMTGYSVERLIEDALKGGALGVLRKPFSVEKLVEAVERAKPHGIVLLADDDPAFAESASDILSAAGYRIERAATGQEALDKTLTTPIDCLILDLRLPVLSGVEVFLRLREAGRAVPTIMATGFANEGRAALDRAPFDMLLIKPFGPTALLDAIRAAIGKQRNSHDA